MKKILLLCFAMAMIVSTQAQRKRIEGERDNNLPERQKLSDEQRKKARKMNEEFRRDMMDLRQKDDITVKEWRSRMGELNRKHREDMRGLFGPDQRGQMERRRMGGLDPRARMKRMGPRFDMNNDRMMGMRRQPGLMRERMQDFHGNRNRSFDNMRRRGEIRMLLERRRENMRSFRNEGQMKRRQEMRPQMPRKRRVLS